MPKVKPLLHSAFQQVEEVESLDPLEEEDSLAQLAVVVETLEALEPVAVENQKVAVLESVVVAGTAGTLGIDSSSHLPRYDSLEHLSQEWFSSLCP